jgi:hypothetical protein
LELLSLVATRKEEQEQEAAVGENWKRRSRRLLIQISVVMFSVVEDTLHS